MAHSVQEESSGSFTWISRLFSGIRSKIIMWQNPLTCFALMWCKKLNNMQLLSFCVLIQGERWGVDITSQADKLHYTHTAIIALLGHAVTLDDLKRLLMCCCVNTADKLAFKPTLRIKQIHWTTEIRATGNLKVWQSQRRIWPHLKFPYLKKNHFISVFLE